MWGADGIAACQFALAHASKVTPLVADSRGIGDLIFERTVVDLPFGSQVREGFVVGGKLNLNASHALYGTVAVTFTDKTTAIVQIVNNKFTSSYGGFTIVLRPDSDQVRVNWSLTPLTALVEQLIRENDFTGIGPLSHQSRALIAMGALANTDRFIKLTAAYGPNGGTLARMCRLTPAPSGEIAWWRRRVNWS